MKKKIYSLKTSVMNGTVTMQTIVDNFLTRELAEKTKDAVIKANEGKSSFNIWCTIDETTLYENENDVPILNKHEDTEDITPEDISPKDISNDYTIN